MSLVSLLFLIAFSIVCALGMVVQKKLKHDSDCFTQGFVIHDDGYMYESCGLYGKSTLKKLDPKTMEILKQVPVSAEYFAEVDYTQPFRTSSDF